MRRREVLALLTGAAALRPSTARLQTTRKLPLVGFLGALSSSAYASQVAALLSGLRELGYIDGTNIRIEFRWAEGNYDLLPQLAAEYEHLKVDVLVTPRTPGTLAAKAASKTIPIVAAAIGDPVITGVVTRRRGQMGFRVGVRRDSRLLFAESGFDSRSVDGCGGGGLRALLDSTG